MKLCCAAISSFVSLALFDFQHFSSHLHFPVLAAFHIIIWRQRLLSPRKIQFVCRRRLWQRRNEKRCYIWWIECDRVSEKNNILKCETKKSVPVKCLAVDHCMEPMSKVNISVRIAIIFVILCHFATSNAHHEMTLCDSMGHYSRITFNAWKMFHIIWYVRHV